jgi:hypothetical protein
VTLGFVASAVGIVVAIKGVDATRGFVEKMMERF